MPGYHVDDLDTSREYWSGVLLECPLTGICLIFFSLDETCVFWGESLQRKSQWHHLVSRVCTLEMTYRCWPDPDHWAEVVLGFFTTLLSPPFHTVPFERSHYEKSTLGEWGLSSISWRVKELRKFGILLQDGFVSSPPFIYSSIIYLCQYRIIGTYFIFWIIIRCYFILLFRLFWLWPLGARSVGSCVPGECPHQCGILFCFV